MPTFNDQVDIVLAGNSGVPETSIGEESLVVTHSENGLSPGVTFNNALGDYFVQRFTFNKAPANIPNGESGSLVADWNGITMVGTETLRFSIGTPWHIGFVPGAPILHGRKYGYQLPDNVIVEITGTGAQVNGDLTVTGDVFLIGGADCAEDFDIMQQEKVEPGTVMIITDTGKLEESRHAYDKRVAGVISGAGAFKPAITLDKQLSENNRQPIAMLGKVFCKVDAQYGAVEVGDMLTTSPTSGYAMKALDPFKAFGSVIGKALKPLKNGMGLLPILVTMK
jgi:hypothetical protein